MPPHHFFEFNLETGRVREDPHNYHPGDGYAVRYVRYENRVGVEIGDGLRHTCSLGADHWDRLLKIIRDDELDESGFDLLLDGFMGYCWPDDRDRAKRNFVDGIKSGKIRPLSDK